MANFIKEYYRHYWSDQRLKQASARARQRHSLIAPHLGSRTGKALDIGCGHGENVNWLAQMGFKVTGCDIAPDAVERVKKMGHEAFVCDLEEDPDEGLPEAPYDLIVCLEVLEHLVDPLTVLKKLCSALAAPDGILVLSIPNEFHLLRRVQVLLGITAFGGHEWPHLRFFSPVLAQRLISAAGCTVVGHIGQPIFPPRMALLERINRPLATWRPSLFALSDIYLLRPLSS